MRQHDTFVLHDLLGEMEDTKRGAVILDRMNFNSNGHRRPPGGLVIRDYTHRVVHVAQQVVVGKPLVLLTAMAHIDGAHEVVLQQSWRVVTADRAEWSNTTQHHTYEPFRLNH